jgi:hypothetical protein
MRLETQVGKRGRCTHRGLLPLLLIKAQARSRRSDAHRLLLPHAWNGGRAGQALMLLLWLKAHDWNGRGTHGWFGYLLDPKVSHRG